MNEFRLIFSIVCLVLQAIPLVVAYFIWKCDCERLGKENLAVPLEERLWAGLICFPFWMGPIIAFAN